MYQVGIIQEGDTLEHPPSLADGGVHESIDMVGKDGQNGQTSPGTSKKELPSKVENLFLFYFFKLFSLPSLVLNLFMLFDFNGGLCADLEDRIVKMKIDKWEC